MASDGSSLRTAGPLSTAPQPELGQVRHVPQRLRHRSSAASAQPVVQYLQNSVKAPAQRPPLSVAISWHPDVPALAKPPPMRGHGKPRPNDNTSETSALLLLETAALPLCIAGRCKRRRLKTAIGLFLEAWISYPCQQCAIRCLTNDSGPMACSSCVRLVFRAPIPLITLLVLHWQLTTGQGT